MSQSTFIVSPGPAITLASGAPAGAGDQVKVDPEVKENARHIAAGRLVETKPKTRRKATKESS